MVYKDPPLKETKEDYTTGADTFVPALTRVDLLAVREDDDPPVALVRYHGTQSVFQIPVDLLREPYVEEFVVKDTEDPLESREFSERCHRYRRLTAYADQKVVTMMLDEIKDFIRHHYQLYKPRKWYGNVDKLGRRR